MGMTYAQSSRLKEIIKDIEKGPTHPSENVRKGYANFSAAELENAKNRIQKVIEAEDGFLAFHIIREWHRPGSDANVIKYVNVTFPKV